MSGTTIHISTRTQIEHFERGEQSIFEFQILVGSFRAVIFDERIAASAQDVVVDAVHAPVEMRPSELIVDDEFITDKVRRPVRVVPLPQMVRENLGCRRFHHRRSNDSQSGQ